jgi:2-polyprenyl-3-methyl-5-hydroxy-6-metoxy-1,4-benzoquinol methylase
MRNSKSNILIKQKWSAPDPNLLAKIKSIYWTSHNIPLTASETTITDPDKPVIGDEMRIKAIKQNLYMFAGREGSLAGLKLIDLGCLEGGMAFEMAREDMDVTGVEGRESNFLKCKLIKDYYGLQNLRFLHLDVKKLRGSEHGVFDIVLCAGLFYHLDAPLDFLSILKDITHEKGLLFLDTHIAPPDREQLEICRFRNSLSEIEPIEYEGRRYEGRYYHEYEEDGKEAGHEWSSVSNYRSFWLTQTSLIKALYYSGFKKIYNLYGGLEIDREFKLRDEYSRLYCIALREGFFDRT